MKKKIFSLFVAVLCIISVFSACKKQAETHAPETASQISDSEAKDIGKDFISIAEQESLADTATPVASSDAFDSQAANPERKAVSYYGAEDLELSFDAYADKIFSIKTVGSVTVSSPVFSLILEEAKALVLNAKADNVTIKASDINTDIKSATGNICIKGKNVTLSVYNGSIDSILINNSTAVIKNFTDTPFNVTLTNGSKISIPAYHTYLTKTNEIKDNATALN